MFLNEFRTISKTVLAKSGGGAAAPLAGATGRTSFWTRLLVKENLVVCAGLKSIYSML